MIFMHISVVFKRIFKIKRMGERKTFFQFQNQIIKKKLKSN